MRIVIKILFFSFIFLVFSSIVFGYKSQRIAKDYEIVYPDTEDVKPPKIRGYIIQFKSEPLLLRNFEQETSKPQNFLEKFFNMFLQLLNLQQPKSNIKEIYRQELENQHEVFEIYASVVLRKDIEDLKIGEFFDILNGVVLDIDKEEAERLRKHSQVKSVYPNYEVRVMLMDAIPLINADYMWLLDRNGDRCSQSGEECLMGDGVTVAVIDTGVDYTHPDLDGKVAGQHCYCSGFSGFRSNCCPNGQKEQHGSGAAMDDNGHGTHVAGIVAADGDLKGVAPHASLVAYKVLDSFGSGLESDIIAGIERAVHDGADIISMSLGGWGVPNDPFSQAVDAAVDSGVIVVVAAGNSGPEGDDYCRHWVHNSNHYSICSPGTAEKAITVGASDKQNHIAGFSSRGPTIRETLKPDVVGPGVLICSSRMPDFEPWNVNPAYELCVDNEHVLLSGTSMATPLVAGAVALLKQAHPEWTPEQIKSVLMSGVVDLGGDIWSQGTGRIDVLRSYRSSAVVQPSALFIGNIVADGSTFSQNFRFRIRNLEDEREVFSISAILISNGATASVDKNTITLNRGSSDSFVLSVEVDTSSIDSGYHEGEIVITPRTGESVRVPFVFYVGRFITLEFNEIPAAVVIHDNTHIVDSTYDPFIPVFLKFDQSIIIGIESIFGDDPPKFVIKEDIAIEDELSLTINKNEASHRVSFVPLDEGGNRLSDIGQRYVMLKYRDQDIVGLAGIITWGDRPHDPIYLYISELSDNYLLEFIQFNHLRHNTKSYDLRAHVTGIHRDTTVSNDPSQTKHYQRFFTFEPGVQDIFTWHGMHYFFNGWGIIGWKSGSIWTEDLEKLDPPYTQDVYYNPIPYEEFDFPWTNIQLEELIREDPVEGRVFSHDYDSIYIYRGVEGGILLRFRISVFEYQSSSVSSYYFDGGNWVPFEIFHQSAPVYEEFIVREGDVPCGDECSIKIEIQVSDRKVRTLEYVFGDLEEETTTTTEDTSTTTSTSSTTTPFSPTTTPPEETTTPSTTTSTTPSTDTTTSTSTTSSTTTTSEGTTTTTSESCGSHCDWEYCNPPDCICSDGEGDCDIDNDCEGGLICCMNVGSRYGCDSAVDVCLSENECDELKGTTTTTLGTTTTSIIITPCSEYCKNTEWYSGVNYQWGECRGPPINQCPGRGRAESG